MKLLIITQKVNKNDSVLGFFHGWIEKFAEKFEKITVICLEKGGVDLPENVSVFSLGKEATQRAASQKFIKSPQLNKRRFNGVNKVFKVLKRIIYILKFYKCIWREKKNYEIVFAHMNQEYVLFGGLLWKILGKKIFLWRNHPKGSFFTRVAVWLSDKVFYTSPFSYTARFKKGVMMPVGVSCESKVKSLSQLNKNQFNGTGKVYKEEDLKILCLGRIAPVKNIEVIIEAMKILKEKEMKFQLSVVGDALEKDEEYYDELKFKVESEKLKKEVRFLPGVPNRETLEVYAKHDIFINATETGSMDKTIFEAIFAGLPVITSNKALRDFFGTKYADLLLFKEGDADSLSFKIEKIREFFCDSEGEKMVLELRKKVEEEQSLEKLSERLFKIFKEEENNA